MEPENQAPEQPETDSGVEDRIASIFGGPEPEAEQSPEPSTEDTFELDWEGEKFLLPKKLEKGFMQERDYTQGKQVLAEQRRALEHASQRLRIEQAETAFAAEVASDQSALAALKEQLKAFDSLDWRSLSADDRHIYSLEQARLDRLRAAKEDEIGKKREAFKSARDQAEMTLRQSVAEQVAKMIPGWDETTDKALLDYAQAEGLQDAIPDIVSDPRFVKILWKASQFDQVKAQARPAVARALAVKTSPSNPMPDRVKADLNFRKVASRAQSDQKFAQSRDFRAALEDRIARKFGG